MLFNSYIFLFAYLPVVFVGFFVIARKSESLGALWLALASLFFYGWWNPQFVSLLLASIIFNYVVGAWLLTSTQKKPILIASITLNIGLLCFYKYFNFFVSTANTFGSNFDLLNIILPLGISFFTFTQIAYLVDVYEGKVHETHFIHYLLFVTWFPHLIAGPILHHRQMMPQFANKSAYRPDLESISIGLSFFALGLFKKVVLADQFAEFANPLFDTGRSSDPMLLASWIGALAYTFQLYFDFSGYSDMAIGLSRLFNIQLPINFDSPYKARNIIDFWRRWHITLSNFLRDYLYIPLGGNKKGKFRRHFNLFSAMLLGGLWHGSGWNFVLWGAMHGVYLMINHFWRYLTGSNGKQGGWLAKVASGCLTFVAVVFAWVPFRSYSLADTLGIWRGMIGLNGSNLAIKYIFPNDAASAQEAFRWLALGCILVFTLPNTQQLVNKLFAMRASWAAKELKSLKGKKGPELADRFSALLGIFIGCCFFLSVLMFKKNSPFIYFQF